MLCNGSLIHLYRGTSQQSKNSGNLGGMVPNIEHMLVLLGGFQWTIDVLAVCVEPNPNTFDYSGLFLARAEVEEEKVLKERKEMRNPLISHTEVGKDSNMKNRNRVEMNNLNMIIME